MVSFVISSKWVGQVVGLNGLGLVAEMTDGHFTHVTSFRNVFHIELPLHSKCFWGIIRLRNIGFFLPYRHSDADFFVGGNGPLVTPGCRQSGDSNA